VAGRNATILPQTVLSPVRKGGDSPPEHKNKGQDMTGKLTRRTRWVQLATFLSRSVSGLLPQLAPPVLHPIRITERAAPHAVNGRRTAKGVVRH
jgi:hypothetical protein